MHLGKAKENAFGERPTLSRDIAKQFPDVHSRPHSLLCAARGYAGDVPQRPRLPSSADISKVHGGVHRTECASTTMPPEVLPDSSASELKSNVHSAAILLAASNSRIESCVSPPTKTTFLSEALVPPVHNRTTARSQTRVFISSPDSAKSAPARFSFQTNRDSKVAHGDDASTSRADLSSTSSPAEHSSTQALPSTSCTQAASLADRISAVQYEPVTEECVGGDIRCTHACGCSTVPAALCDDVRKSVHSSVAFRSKVAVPLLHYVRTASSSSTCDALNKLEYSSHLQPTVDGSSLAAVSVGCDSQRPQDITATDNDLRSSLDHHPQSSLAVQLDVSSRAKAASIAIASTAANAVIRLQSERPTSASFMRPVIRYMGRSSATAPPASVE